MKDRRNFESDVLSAKKRKLTSAVKQASKSLGIPFTVDVNITEEPCPQYSGNERAHIHIEKGLICVWERDLVQMDFEEIRAVAAHEVAHLRSVRHDSKHADTKTEIQTATWKPPSGVIWNVPGKENQKIERKEAPPSERLERFTVKELRQLARDKNLSGYSNLRRSELIEMITKSLERTELKEKILEWSCSYHLCEETGMNMEKCKYCGKTFCKEHIKACLPSPPPFKDLTVDRKEWAGDGHPCPEYPKHVKNKEVEELKARKKALDVLLRNEIPEESRNKRPGAKEKSEESSLNQILIGVAVIIGVL